MKFGNIVFWIGAAEMFLAMIAPTANNGFVNLGLMHSQQFMLIQSGILMVCGAIFITGGNPTADAPPPPRQVATPTRQAVEPPPIKSPSPSPSFLDKLR
jgi:hypothetical protein